MLQFKGSSARRPDTQYGTALGLQGPTDPAQEGLKSMALVLQSMGSGPRRPDPQYVAALGLQGPTVRHKKAVLRRYAAPETKTLNLSTGKRT